VLVAFEGIDGSGKSTLVPLVARRLRARRLRVVVTQEPTTGWSGRLVRKGLHGRAHPLAQAGLFLADRAVHVAQLGPSLLRGEIVLTDRYVDSTTAYQAAALQGKMSNPLETLRLFQASVFPRPDVVVWLDLPPKSALRRIRHRHVKEPYERERFLAKVSANYRRLARRDPRRWLRLDARRPLDELARAASSQILRRAGSVGTT
jgi:dTMP kinase